MARARTTLPSFLGVEPYADTPYFIGYKIGDQDIGLDPNGHQPGATAYYRVDDIQLSLQTLLQAMAEILEAVRDVGGGRLIASVQDAEGNLIGLLQDT